MNVPLERKHREWLLPAFSGLLIGTSYIPFPPWASLFCFVPLWIFWSRQTCWKRVVFGGVLASVVFTLVGFNWVTYLLHEFAGLPWPLAVLGMLAFAFLAHCFVPVAGLAWYLVQRYLVARDCVSIGLMAVLTAICERYSLTLFDWNFGYSWFGSGIPIFHWAELIGFKGLSAMTILFNLPLYWAWASRRRRRAWHLLAATLSGLILLNLGGLWLESRIPPPDAKVTVLLVQGNIGNSEKLAAELGEGYPEAILNTYVDLTDRARTATSNKIDFVVWPETAFPALLGEAFRTSEYPAILRRFLKDRRLALVTGAYGVEPSARMLTNSLFALDRNGELTGPYYSKSILLAFGEYIPGESIFPGLRDLLPPTGQFARGAGPTSLLELNGYRMGPQICYESLFPDFSRALADLGAQFIVNATNDSWYGKWQEPYQHFYMTLARGVEFRLPVLRVTNTGISSVALASGEILQRSPLHVPWTGLYQVPFLRNPPSTFYQRWFHLGDAVLGLSLICLLTVGYRSRQSGERTK